MSDGAFLPSEEVRIFATEVYTAANQYWEMGNGISGHHQYPDLHFAIFNIR